MEKDLYLPQIDYFKGAKVLNYLELSSPIERKDEHFNTHEIHALVICDYAGEEVMLFYLDDGLEVVMEYDFDFVQHAKAKAQEDFSGVDLQWKNK